MLIPMQTERKPRVLSNGRKKAACAALLSSAGVVAMPVVANAYTLDKWWEGKLGSWASGNWTTQSQATQTLKFKTCSHNWSSTWGDSQNVEIQLVEVKDFLPDPVLDSWKYACNNADQTFVSGTTNSTKFHFDFEPNVDARTDGTMTVYYS